MDGVDEDEEDDENEEGEEGKDLVANESKEDNDSDGNTKVNKESEKFLHQLIQRCAEQTPNQGELWCSIAKRTANRRKDAGTVLLIGVEEYLATPLKYFNYATPHPAVAVANSSSSTATQQQNSSSSAQK
jgi:hypothetical protein